MLATLRLTTGRILESEHCYCTEYCNGVIIDGMLGWRETITFTVDLHP